MKAEKKITHFAWVKKLSSSVSNGGDNSRLASALGCRYGQSVSLTENLIESTEQIEILHGLLFAQKKGTNKYEQFLSEDICPESILRVLLTVPSIYESPWHAACDCVSSLHSMKQSTSSNIWNRSSRCAIIAEIQIFLQQTLIFWCEHRRRFNSSKIHHQQEPRKQIYSKMEVITDNDSWYWILRLTKLVMGPLLEEQKKNDREEKEKEDYWTAPLQLIGSIVYLSQDMEPHFKEAVLNIVFQQRIRADRIEPWLNLANELHTFLRDSDWKIVREITESMLLRKESLSVQNYAGLSKATISWSINVLKESHPNRREFYWCKHLLLHILLSASSDHSTFSAIETVCRSSFSSLNVKNLRSWILLSDQFPDPGTIHIQIPKWLRVNLILNLIQVLRQSDSEIVSRLVAKASDKNGYGDDLTLKCWDKLVNSAFPEETGDYSRKNRRHNSSNWKEIHLEIERLLCGVNYVGYGLFHSTEEKGLDVEFLNSAGSLIFQSIFLGRKQQHAETSNKLSGAQRAHSWVKTIGNILKSRSVFCAQDFLLAIVAWIIIFFEIPMSRSSLVREMLQWFNNENALLHSMKNIAFLQCFAVVVIIRSAGANMQLLEELNPLVDNLEKISIQSIFFELADALSPLHCAQNTLLLLSRKYLQMPLGGGIWHDHISTHVSDNIKCGLYSLCVLINTSNWSRCQVDAWKMLSDRIVLNRPPIPVPFRTWLFEQLTESCQKQKLNLKMQQHLFRACLVRLLHFFDVESRQGTVELNQANAFKVWIDPSSLLTKTRRQEDIPGLFLLIQALFFSTINQYSNNRSYLKEIVTKGRTLILQSILTSTNCFEKNTKGPIMKKPANHHALLCSITTIYSVILVIQFIIGLECQKKKNLFLEKTLNEFPSLPDILGRLQLQELEVMEKIICDDEKERLLPGWLKVNLHIPCSDRSPPASTLPLDSIDIKEIGLILSDLIVELVQDDRWSFFQGHVHEFRCVLLALSALVVCKSMLSNSVNGNVNFQISRFQHGNPFNKIGKFLEVSAFVVQDSIASNRSIYETNMIVALVIDHLDVLQHLIADEKSRDVCKQEEIPFVLNSLWQIYISLCCEVSAIQFISCSEESCNAEEVKRLKGLMIWQNFSFLLVESPETVDIAIRQIRSRLLCSLSLYLDFVQYHLASIQSLNNYSHFNSLAVRTNTSGQTFALLLGFVRALCTDLNCGLEGHSGGITVKMFHFYIDSTHNCVNLLIRILPNIHIRETLQFGSLLSREAVMALERVICHHQIKAATLYEKLFLLLSSSLPALARHAIRRALEIPGNIRNFPVAHVMESMRGFAIKIQSSCLEHLKRYLMKVIDRDENQLMYATFEHLFPTEEFSSHELFNESKGYPISHKELIDVKSASIPVNTKTQEKGNHFDSGGLLNEFLAFKNVWSWSSSSALLAMDNNWNESSLLIQTDAQVNAILKISSHEIIYGVHRRIELSDIIRSIGLLLKSKEPRMTKNMATFLPNTSKTRLMSLLYTISFTIQRSLNVIMAYLKDARNKSSEMPKNNLALIESMSCLLAWIDCDRSILDFAIGSRNWHAAERERQLRKTLTETECLENTSLKQFPKLIHQIEKLESSLQQLRDLLLDFERAKSKDDKYLSLLLLYENITDSSNKTEKCTKKQISLYHLTEYGLNILKEKNDEIENCTKQNKSESHQRGKRKRGKKTAKSLSRNVQSHNQVINDWLQMDQDIGPEESVFKDAYLDLEDFIVEG